MTIRIARRLSHKGQGLTLFIMALLAMGVAFVLSPPGMSAWAGYQAPGSPVSPLSPVPTQSLQSPTRSPTILAITPTSLPETPSPAATQPSQSSGRGTLTLVMGGIVLLGLIVGAVVLLVRGQPGDDSTS
ncbi:MAG: hypothetical protein P8186_29590 [Anaerolineae bacterium]